MSNLEKILIFITVIIYSLLAVFSYAYVDLNLTISQNPIVIQFVRNMQQLGYFNRPTATLIYLFFIIFSFSFFVLNLRLFYRLRVGLRYLWLSTIAVTLILIFAYPFLSSDLFNYLFDAKILLNYHASPYTHRPLDFSQDEWLRFMRWIHRYSPYGPLWLGASLIPAVLGFGKFILNFLTFKIFIGIFHILNSWLIYKTLKIMNNKKALLGTAFYALNPLFLIEGVANAHNDVVLATSLLLSIYLYVCSKKIWSIIALLSGAAIKYIPILNLPWLLLVNYYPKFRFSKEMDNCKFLTVMSFMTMAIFTYLYSSFRITVPFVSSGATQVQFQPWYLFWTIPYIALIPNFRLLILAIAISIGASLRYLPYLYYGDWSGQGTVIFMQAVTIVPVSLVGFFLLIKKLAFKK